MPEPVHREGMRQQIDNLQQRRAAGMPRLGWKIGINVPEVQRRAGLMGSLVGFLNGERVWQSGDEIALPEGARLHVEPELCLKLAARVQADATLEQARGAIGDVRPAFELVDYSLPRSDLTTTIAHSMFHHGVVLGAPQPTPSPELVREVAAQLAFHVGTSSARARADLVPADLAALVLRAAAVLAEVGETLEPGDLLMSGSFTEAALPLKPGDLAHASFASLGELACRAMNS